MKRKKATGYDAGGPDQTTSPFGGDILNPEFKDTNTSLDGGHSSPSIGVKPHAEDCYAEEEIGLNDLTKFQFSSGENVGDLIFASLI